MKKIALLLLPLLLSASQDIDVYKKILELENEIKLLKAQVEENAQKRQSTHTSVVTIKEQVEQNTRSIDEDTTILEKIETKSILDKVNFSPEIMLRFNKFHYTTGAIEGENTKIYNNSNPALNGLQRRDEFSKDFDLAASMRFRLNMNFTLEDIKFHGRMLYMNSTQSNQRICILSRDIKSGTPGSAFDVDRAYVDYTVNKTSSTPFTLSFGILPTSGGTPMQYGQNKKRSSLFPALVFDMNTYGVIGTQKIAQDTYARLVLAKAYTLRPNFYPYQCNRENIDNADIIGIYGDSKINFLGNSLLSFGVNIMHDLKAHPYLGPDIDSSNSSNLGTIITYGLGIDIEKFQDSDLTVFAHTAFTTPHANNKRDDYKITNPVAGTTDGGYTGFTEADYASGPMLNKNSYSVYLGLKYDVTQDINIGAEYNYGSKYWYSGTQGAEDMYNKLALRGSAYEAYTSWQFHKYLNAKLGYLYMQENYTGSGWHFGEPAKKDAQQNIGYLNLEARF